MKPEDIKVEVRNKALGIVGEVPTVELQFELHKLYANIGTWSLTLPVGHALTDNLDTPGSGVVVSLNGEVIASGPTISPDTTQKYDDPKGMITFRGVTDTVVIQDALAFPDPANPAGSQTKVHDKRTGPAETLMHGYVRDNIGPDAIASRKNANLTMGSNGARGKTVTRKPRFKNLGTVVAGLAKAGRLGFEVIQSGSDLEFRTYAVRDKSTEVVLNVEDDSMSAVTLTQRALAATNVIVGGPGHGKKRKFKDVSTTESNALSDEWGRRIEVYMDYRGADDTPEATDLVEAGEDWLDDEMEHPIRLKVTPSEYEPVKYGTAWRLGDKIKVVVRGRDRIVTATGLILKVDENGARYGVTLGDPIMRGGSGNAGNGTQRGKPGRADADDDIAMEVPDLSETTLDGLDYVVENRVLLLDNGQTVADYVATHDNVPIQVGTIIFEKA